MGLKKWFKVTRGDHMIPNPDYKPGEDDPTDSQVGSHITVSAGKSFLIDVDRAIAFTRRTPGDGFGPKLEGPFDSDPCATEIAVAKIDGAAKPTETTKATTDTKK